MRFLKSVENQTTFKSSSFIASILQFSFTGGYRFSYVKILNLHKLILELKRGTFDFVFQNQQHIEESQTGWAGGVGFLFVLCFDLMKSYISLHLHSSILKHEAHSESYNITA